MKITEITEASYVGNIGIMELMQFQKIATPEEKLRFEQLIKAKNTHAAWELVTLVTKTSLQSKILVNSCNGRF
jgi:hypothetical protein